MNIDLTMPQPNYNYFRDYDPNVGRYLESDPIGVGGGANSYIYATNNPTTLIDPHGLQPFDPGPPPPDPAPGFSAPGFDTFRDPRNPWLPPNWQNRKSGRCPPYYRVTGTYQGQRVEGIIPLVKEEVYEEVNCITILFCT
jgi:hypothetical protein